MVQGKKMLVVCPTAAATSTFIGQQLRSLFAREGMNVDIKICSTIEVASVVKAYTPDLIVSSSGLLPETTGQVPVLPGLPFLTGIGKADLERQVIRILKGNGG